MLELAEIVLAIRSACSDLLDFDHEIERTFHTRCRLNLANTSSSTVNECDSDSLHSFSLHTLFDSELVLDNNMAERTLRKLVALDVNYNGLWIEYADVTVPFELKSGLIRLFPKFSGLAGEDPI